MKKYVEEIKGSVNFSSPFSLCNGFCIREVGYRKKGHMKSNSFNNKNDYNFVYYGILLVIRR